MMAQDQQQEAAASTGLGKFKKLSQLSPNKEKLFAAADTGNLQLAAPLATAIVPLDKLKQYKTGQPATDVITNMDELVYPVVNGQSKKLSGTMTLAKVGGRWSAARFNADKEILQDSAALLISQGSVSYKLVKILPFHVSFLSFTDSGGLEFIPLQEDRERDLHLGRPVKAELVLEKYVKAANDYNGLPM